MESWPPQRRVLPGPLPSPWLLGLFLLPWTLQLAGAEERSVTHTGLPIVVSLANKTVSFNCKITYPYTTKFKDFTVDYFYVDLQGRESSKEKINCNRGQGRENETHTTNCPVTPKLPDASATGTYYCSVGWWDSKMIGNGTFILVRDTGYREPPQGPQKLLLFCFIGILTVLSILATALLLWKKMQAPRKHPGPSAARSQEQPPSESIYTHQSNNKNHEKRKRHTLREAVPITTKEGQEGILLTRLPCISQPTDSGHTLHADAALQDLQRRQTEVYDCIQSEARSPLSTHNLLSQEKQHSLEGDGEFNMVYENL